MSSSIATAASRAGGSLSGSGLFTLPARPTRINLFVLGWGAGWGITGGLVASGILFSSPRADFMPLLTTSVLFAEVVGFTSLVSARVVFPLYARLVVPLRIALQVVTLFAGTVLGSIAVLATQPLYSLANWRLVSVIVLVNAFLAVLVGLALFTYDTMRRQLEASYAALREKERMERELSIAREVQHELLPRFAPSVAGIEVAGRCVPAIGVGGDYYDFLTLPDERLGLIIADVAGKGIPAALLMAGLQASARSLAIPGRSPSEIVRRLNATLLASVSAARYATFFLGLYDARERCLLYCNAGHFPPLHIGTGGRSRLVAGGMPIGLFSGIGYEEGRLSLEPGDLLVLYTDGVTEAPAPDGGEFGEDRLEGSLAARRSGPLEELLDGVIGDVDRWKGGGPAHDDLTLVVARIR